MVDYKRRGQLSKKAYIKYMPTRHIFDEAHSGNRVGVSAGEQVRITLIDNPSTGASWKVTDSPLFLALTADSFETDIPDAPPLNDFPDDEWGNEIVGGDARHTFDFVVLDEAIVGSEGTISFQRSRAWTPEEVWGEYSLEFFVKLSQ